jgi:hypothetical protein
VLRVICVNTGDKYSDWHTDNLKHMVDKYSGLVYNEFVIIQDDVYDDERGVFNKLQMFERYTDGQNIYFDLDVLIKGDCNHFLKNPFTLCHAWWRDAYHTPLNSSIVSWKGDVSHIFNLFIEDPEFYMFKYRRGIDQFIYENIEHETYSQSDRYCSYQTVTDEEDYAVYLFNQNYERMGDDLWFKKYFLSPTP